MSDAGRTAVEPRACTMVAFLETKVGTGDLDPCWARVMNLAALLQRNGLLQVAVFLKAKGRPDAKGKPEKADERLRKLLEEAIRKVVGASPNRDGKPFALEASYLAKLDMSQALLLEEVAVEAAVWIRRLYEATVDKRESEKKTAGEKA
jgi:hypothetical protein